MRFMQLFVFILVMFMTSAWATGVQGAGKVLDKFKQQQSRSQSQVNRLEHDVSTQQSDSAEASKRLQQQDKAIAELRKQLQKLKARSPTGQH